MYLFVGRIDEPIPHFESDLAEFELFSQAYGTSTTRTVRGHESTFDIEIGEELRRVACECARYQPGLFSLLFSST